MFYEGFDAKQAAFSAKHYADRIDKGADEFAVASVGEPHFEFDSLGNVCLVRRGSEPTAASVEARELFRRAQLLFREVSNALVARGASMRDHAMLSELFTEHPSLGSVDRKERRFSYKTREASVSADLITQALGGVAPLPILQAVIGGLGEDIKIAISEQRTNQRMAHVMIVVNEALPFPTASFTLFGVTASEVERAGDFDCLRASARDITFDYDQETWMLLDPDLLTAETSEDGIARLAAQLTTSDEAAPASMVLPADLPPSNAAPSEALAAALESVAETDDVGAQPDPPEGAPGEFEVAADLSDVKWPSSDENAPDYAYLAGVSSDAEFTLDAEAVRRLMAANRYQPATDSGAVAIAFRGAQLAEGHEQERKSAITLKELRPDHRAFNCVIGFFFPGDDTLTLYTGSTVPCRAAVRGYAMGGDASNMLPTGLYTYHIWRHKQLRPALRLASGNGSNGELETGRQATVLRSREDTVLGTKDIFDLSRPLDNVHCSYYLNEDPRLGASFSSWGCLTVRGAKTPSHQWEKFQAVLSDIGSANRVDLMLATGKDAALAAAGNVAPLVALRQGSTGDEVKRVQAELGLGQTGYFGPVTQDKFTGAERHANEAAGLGRIATGILTPAVAATLGWQVFQGS